MVRNFLKEFGRYDQLGPEVLENLDFEMHKMFVYASHNHILIDTYERLSAMFSLGYFCLQGEYPCGEQKSIWIYWKPF